MQIVSRGGSVTVISDGRTTRVYLSADWEGTIECEGRLSCIEKGAATAGGG
jgi:hypothetical protein